MTWYPFNPNMGQRLQGDGAGIVDDMGFIAHRHFATTDAVAASANGVHAAITLGASAADVTTAITNPSCPKCLSIVGNVAATVQAAHTFNMTNADSDLTLTAVPIGVLGNAISCEFLDPLGNNQALTVTVTDSKISVSLATGAGGAITSTAAEVKAAMNGEPTCAALVATEDENAGAGVVNALAEAPLTGGITKSSGDVVITGTDEAGVALSETFALNGTTTVAGTCAFHTVTNIHVPAREQVADTVAVGWTEKLGLGSKLAHNTMLAAYLNNTREATLPTVAVHATDLSKNVADFDTGLSGTVGDLYFIV